MEPKTNADGAPLHRIVLRRIMRFATDYGGIPLLIGVFGGTSECIESISDPTERGLA